MVDKLAMSLVNQMIDGKLIEDEQKEHYFYALITMIERAILVDNLQILLEVLLGAICAIEIIGTVNHPNMHLDNVELVNLSKSARILVILEGSVIYALALGNGNCLYVCYMSIAVILCAILQCLAKLMKQEAKKSAEAEKDVHRYR